jgi:hypothetical protein
MNEKENTKNNAPEKKPTPSITRSNDRGIKAENIAATEKLHEVQEGSRKSRGKKQRRQFKLAPNRG